MTTLTLPLTRMIDRMGNKARGIAPPSWISDMQFTKLMLHDGLLNAIAAAPVIVIDNVAEYLYAGTDQEYWDFDRDFPNVAPPFPSFWMEYHRPSLIRSKVYGENDKFSEMGMRAAGAQFDYMDYRPGDPIADMMFERMAALSTEQGRDRPLAYYRETTRWIATAIPFLEGPAGVMGPLLTNSFAVDHDGRITGVLSMVYLDGPANLSEEMAGDIPRGSNPFLFPAFLAISFMHCRNVAVRDGAAPPEKWAKKYEARNGARPKPYYVIQIDPMREVLRREGESDSRGIQHAIAKCRGHFKTYSDERKLFGRHAGTYWWQGWSKAGDGLARYNVLAPREG